MRDNRTPTDVCGEATLKQDGVDFDHCPKQGNKIEGIAVNRVFILGMFCPKQGQGFKP